MKKGFTLIELAIALMVIGLIIGMAMKGRAVVTASQIKSDLNAINKVTAAMSIYEAKYGELPGASYTTGAYPSGVQVESVAAFYYDLMDAGLIKESDFYINMENAYIGLIGCTPTATGFTAESGIYYTGTNKTGTRYKNTCMYMTETKPSDNKLFGHSTGPSITTPKYACYLETQFDNYNLGSGNGRLKSGGAGKPEYSKSTNCETDYQSFTHSSNERYYYIIY